VSDIDRLHQIIDTLAPQQVRALLALLEAHEQVDNEEFVRRLAEAAEEEIDEETAARILASESEAGELITHQELKQRLG
jgi:hypothetical protein